MKKQQMKKLALAKETLQSLEHDGLKFVEGGAAPTPTVRNTTC